MRRRMLPRARYTATHGVLGAPRSRVFQRHLNILFARMTAFLFPQLSWSERRIVAPTDLSYRANDF